MPDDRPLHGTVASAGSELHRAYDLEEELLEGRIIAVEDPDDLRHINRLDSSDSLQSHIMIGNERNPAEADLRLSGEDDLRILCHVDDFPSLLMVGSALGACGESRAVHDDDRSSSLAADSELERFAVHMVGSGFAIRVRSCHMGDRGSVVEGVFPALGPVHELIEDDEISWPDIGLETADRARSEDLPDSEHPECLDVRPIVDLVRRDGVPGSMARKEGDPLPGDGPDLEDGARVPVLRRHGDIFGHFQQIVES